MKQMNFSADVSRLLDIVANALYTTPDVFLRELISNAADACDKLRYEALQTPGLVKDGASYRIHVYADPKQRRLCIVDNGIGMTQNELTENLGTIAKSGTAAMMQSIDKNQDDAPSLIGQFGVGFYACYMVASRAEVISRKAGTLETHVWESDGCSGFFVRGALPAEEALLDGDRGTAVVLHIKDSSSDFLLDEKIKQTVQHYSDNISVPIYLGRPADAPAEALNTNAAIWARPKNEITPEQYADFYRHITHGFDEPVMTSHWKAEGKIQYTALLFIPTMRPWDLYDPSRKNAVRLYVKRVFIADHLEGLIYPWLRFVRGVVDTEDLPLNISRESLQFNPALAKIRTGVTRRILSDLDKLAQNDTPAFLTFWSQFGAALKEGLYDAFEHREDIFKLCRFFSTHDNGEKLVSLDDYISRMKDGQTEIYYLSGEKSSSLVHSPQIEGFKAQGYEVLFFTDTIDDFWLQQVQEYKGKVFKSVTRANVAVDKEKPESQTPASKDFLKSLKDVLAGEVSDVRVSQRLVESPVCLVAPDHGADMHMERVLKIQQHYAPGSKPVLEINEDHGLIKKLQAMAAGDAGFKDAALLLLDQAKIIQGEPLSDPAAFARRMSAFMERGL